MTSFVRSKPTPNGMHSKEMYNWRVTTTLTKTIAKLDDHLNDVAIASIQGSHVPAEMSKPHQSHSRSRYCHQAVPNPTAHFYHMHRTENVTPILAIFHTNRLPNHIAEGYICSAERATLTPRTCSLRHH